jgi:hypothetical protein
MDRAQGNFLLHFLSTRQGNASENMLMLRGVGKYNLHTNIQHHLCVFLERIAAAGHVVSCNYHHPDMKQEHRR